MLEKCLSDFAFLMFCASRSIFEYHLALSRKQKESSWEIAINLINRVYCWTVPSVEELEQLSKLPAVASNKLYNLDDAIKVWSDFLHPHMHPRSVHIIDAYQHNRLVQYWLYFTCRLVTHTHGLCHRRWRTDCPCHWHAHTQLFYGPLGLCPALPGLAGTRTIKPGR